jgi:hypothetical protein
MAKIYTTKIRTYCGGLLYEVGDVVSEEVATAIGLEDCEISKKSKDTDEK